MSSSRCRAGGWRPAARARAGPGAGPTGARGGRGAQLGFKRAVLEAAAAGDAAAVAAAAQALVAAADGSGSDGRLAVAALAGRWKQVSPPEFPGVGRAADGRAFYTLGRLSFGQFEPAAVRCALDEIVNVSLPLAAAEGGAPASLTWDIDVLFSVLDGPAAGLRGRMVTHGTATTPGEAEVSEETQRTLRVAFRGGRFEQAGDPGDPEAAARWEAAFGAAARREAARAVGWAERLRTRVGQGAAAALLGLRAEAGAEGATQSYELARAPAGSVDVLFLDADLRVTRGNRGSLVVATRSEP